VPSSSYSEESLRRKGSGERKPDTPGARTSLPMKTDLQSGTGLQEGTLLKKKKQRIRRRIFAECRFWCMGTACGWCMRLPIIPRISNGAEFFPRAIFYGIAGKLASPGRKISKGLKFE
jgi:hypothetical protein